MSQLPPSPSQSGKPSALPVRDFPISNRALLQKLVIEAVARFGSQREAARRTGVDRALISRLMKNKLARIDVGNFDKLHKLIPANRHKSLGRVVMPKGSRYLSRKYDEWLETSAELASAGTGMRVVKTEHGFEERRYDLHSLDGTPRDRERALLWRYVRRRSPHLKGRMDSLTDGYAASGYSRVLMARILDPLINAPESGFIETSWRELRDEAYPTIEKFVELGIKREKLIQRRVPIMERIVGVFLLSRREFEERFGKRATDRSMFPGGQLRNRR